MTLTLTQRRLGILVTMALTLAACGSDPAPTAQPSHTINGIVDLEYGSTRNGSTCVGAGGFSDLHEGTQVLILNESMTTIATGTLSTGTFQPARGVFCTWTFAVADVPSAQFYRVKIGHREGPTYSTAELEGRGWRVELRL